MTFLTRTKNMKRIFFNHNQWVCLLYRASWQVGRRNRVIKHHIDGTCNYLTHPFLTKQRSSWQIEVTFPTFWRVFFLNEHALFDSIENVRWSKGRVLREFSYLVSDLYSFLKDIHFCLFPSENHWSGILTQANTFFPLRLTWIHVSLIATIKDGQIQQRLMLYFIASIQSSSQEQDPYTISIHWIAA